MIAYSKPQDLNIPLYDPLDTSKYWEMLEECLSYNGCGESWDLVAFQVIQAGLLLIANAASRSARQEQLNKDNQKAWALVMASLRAAPDVKITVQQNVLVVANARSGAHLIAALRTHIFNNPETSIYFPVQHLLRTFRQREDQTVSEAIMKINGLNNSLPIALKLTDGDLIGILRTGLTLRYSEIVRTQQSGAGVVTYANICSNLIKRSLEDAVYDTQRKRNQEDDSAHLIQENASLRAALKGSAQDDAEVYAVDHDRSKRLRRDSRDYASDSSTDSISSKSSNGSRGSYDSYRGPGGRRSGRSGNHSSYGNANSSGRNRQQHARLRSPSPVRVKFDGKCDYCSKVGHKEAQCYKKIADLKNNTSSNSSGHGRHRRGHGDDKYGRPNNRGSSKSSRYNK